MPLGRFHSIEQQKRSRLFRLLSTNQVMKINTRYFFQKPQTKYKKKVIIRNNRIKRSSLDCYSVCAHAMLLDSKQ